jgi:hypothetical protein
MIRSRQPEGAVMKIKTCLVVACICAATSFVIAQSVDGKWAGEVQGGRGPQQITLNLKADGGKLTGSITGGRGGEVQIQDGTISGGALKFKSTQMGRGGEVKMTQHRGRPGAGAGVHGQAAKVSNVGGR